MTIFYSSSFEAPETLAQIFDSQVGTTISFDSLNVFSGVRSLHLHQTGVANPSNRNLPAVSQLVGRFGFFPGSVPSVSEQILNVNILNGTNLIFRYQSTGVLQWLFNGNTSQNLITPTPGQYYLIDFSIDLTTTTFTGIAKINGVDQLAISAPLQAGASNVTQIKFGNSGAITIDHWFDVLVLSDNPADYPLANPFVPPPVAGGGGRRLLLLFDDACND